jgi:hypothetical protein
MKLIASTLALGLVLTAGCAPTASTGGPSVAHAEPGARQCFPVQSVNSFTAVDRETVNIRVGVSDYYQIKFLAPCHDIDWALSAGLRPRGGGSFICNAMDVDVVTPSPIGQQVCHVSSLRKLSETEVALLGRDRP